jgi:predicted lipoprotein
MQLPNDPLVWITFALGIGGNLTWSLLFFANSIKRRYAAERDFNHLKNNQKQIADSIAISLKDMDTRFDKVDRDIDLRFDHVDRDLSEIKTYLIGKAIPRREE